MAEMLWGSKSIIPTIYVGDWNSGEILFRYIFEAAQVDAVHLADGSLCSHPEGTHAAYLAEEVVILLGVE
jgi:hypothetical protein